MESTARDLYGGKLISTSNGHGWLVAQKTVSQLATNWREQFVLPRLVVAQKRKPTTDARPANNSTID
jgi:hypothetical protein